MFLKGRAVFMLRGAVRIPSKYFIIRFAFASFSAAAVLDKAAKLCTVKVSKYDQLHS